MKKTVKEYTKKEEVSVCDICGSEDVPISWSWKVNCPYDDCFSDWGEANFCSVDHFIEGIKAGKLVLSKDEYFNPTRSTLEMQGTGVSELTDILSILQKNL